MEYTKISKKMKSPVDGLELDLLILVPEEAPKGILQIHHGMAEYKERYLPFMKYFAEAGYVAAIHDCRGHGKSVRTKKDLGYMYGAGMDALIEDTAEVTRMLKEEWQGVPLILLGHSMGSMVVRCFTKKYDDLLNMLVVCGSPSKNPGAKIGIALAAVQEKISGAHHVSRFLELLSLGSYSGKFAGEGSKYRSFKARSANSFIFYPYLLKEYRNRWFVFGIRKSGRILQNLALDRIHSLEVLSREPFIKNTFFDPNTFFDDLVGGRWAAGSG